jgi:hypothetical protein
MGDKRRQKEEKRQARQRKSKERRAAQRDLFFDVLDSYEAEFQQLLAKPPVQGLAGIFELDDVVFKNATSEERLKHVGLSGYSVVNYDFGPQRTEDTTTTAEPKATGYACTIRDSDNRFYPVIFIRRSVVVDDPQGERANEIIAVNRVCVLLHECGHAQDMNEMINFRPSTGRCNIVEAEAYAHRFALEQAKKLNYRVLTTHYIENLDNQLANHPQEYIRLAVARLYETCDVQSFKDFAAEDLTKVAGWRGDLLRERVQARFKRKSS